LGITRPEILTFIGAFFAFDVGLFFTAFVLLFAVIDPIGAVPIFVSLSEGYPDERKRIVRQAMLVAIAILVIFALFGWIIFNAFGITLNDFRVAGGIILFIVAVDHLRGSEERSKGLEPSDLAVFPMATPLLAGPGAISTVVILSAPPYSPLLDLLVIAGNSILCYLILAHTGWVRRVLGNNGTNALSRITALLIASLAVAFVAQGVTGIFPALG
jgi:MarC family membrane protein